MSTPSEAELGMAWWNRLTERERVQWMAVAGNTGVAADAWAAFRRAELNQAILAQAYNSKAAEALELGRRARQEGREAEVLGYLDEAVHWRAMAQAVTESVQSAGQEVMYP
jgi:hypothetical protein